MMLPSTWLTPRIVPFLSIYIQFAAASASLWYERDAPAGIVQELGPRLSEGARVLLKGEAGFAEKIARWQRWEEPDVVAVVDVRVEEDVEQTIRYANEKDIPFFAQSGGHGSTSALGKIKNGIQINMRGMTDISIAADGESVTLGGGLESKEIIDHLWAEGKQTVTGLCECTGHTAVVLGGGHGLLQGFHGLPADQLLSARLTLANSTSLTTSPTQHPSLFWALRGAGHNFGIVTSMQYRIFDTSSYPGGPTWSYTALAFPATPDFVRKVYTIAQSQVDAQPEGMLQYSLVMKNPDISPNHIILHHLVWNGPLTSPLAARLLKLYHALGPLAAARETGTYLDVPRWLQVHADSGVCRAQTLLPGAGVVRFPVEAESYAIEKLVAAVERFVERASSVDEFDGSFFLLEQYATHTVRDFPADGSAVASRSARVLLAPVFFYPSVVAETGGRNRVLDQLAVQYGEEVRGMLVDAVREKGGREWAYVNYAFGGEGEKEIYGKEKVGRLGVLKGVWDPENRFRFYAPIEPIKVEKRDCHDEL